ncbi:STAS domain-containing protein [Aquimonas voraii]|uniref:Anti-anti-sigma regulatory factor (Antagonist of anti-sigma factor) n=1 Tax=Aquimonas voraii TaxID=265719 RepID=A0A1G6ZHL4_9GAMM|nr:STAS domain-containing protein [Aquimonas voraii]SDE02204.1 Anti-anti-sigma regulatory factor (antagonist of anti-sigma factor) [Aquimonas voraii]
MIAWTLPESLTIQSVVGVREALLQLLSGPADVFELDGRGVQEIDGAGVQLLLATAKEAELRGMQLRLQRSARLAATLTLLALEHRFTPPEPATQVRT